MLSTPGKLPRDGVSLLQEDQGGEGNEVGTCVSPLSEQQAQQGWQHGVFCLPGWAGLGTPRCLQGWAELQALCGWRLCSPGIHKAPLPIPQLILHLLT